ncbi:MAG: hypothetical protein HYU62_06660 [Caulobacterales bacterium]|nr:hypothetical protein [Caulobacterales bacterium]
MLNKGQVWRQIAARLKPGAVVRTWSDRDGLGPEFRIDLITDSAVLITPLSTGKQRRLVQGSFDEVVDYRNSGSARSGLLTRNSSYSLGVLKHLELI